MQALLLLCVSGCSGSRHLSNDFGDSYYQSFNSQVANPAAPLNPDPIVFMPGTLANKIYKEKYESPLYDDSGKTKKTEVNED